MSSAERSTFLVVLYKKLMPRAELEAIAERARVSGAPLLRALEPRLSPEELDRVERTLARHARRCERCPAITHLLPGKTEADTPCERCGAALLSGPPSAPAPPVAPPVAPPAPAVDVTMLERMAADAVAADAAADDEAGATRPPSPTKPAPSSTAWGEPEEPAPPPPTPIEGTRWDAAPVPVEPAAPPTDVTMWPAGATGRGAPAPAAPHTELTMWERPAESTAAPAAPSGEGLIDQLERLVKLRDAGVLTVEEFEKAKRRLLG